MTQNHPTPHPLFDTQEMLDEPHASTIIYIHELNIPQAEKELELCTEFLKSYANSKDTFTAYRREVERLLHWSWLACKKPVKELTRNDIRDYLQFINNPPMNWISVKVTRRFTNDSDGKWH